MPISIAPLNGQSNLKKGAFDVKRYKSRRAFFAKSKRPALIALEIFTGIILQASAAFKRLLGSC
jgi:hypothetical protein